MLTSSAGSSYKWFNGTTQVATTQSYTANAAGSYTVEVTNANNCKATSAATTVTISTGPTWYEDVDGDGFGNAAVTLISCTKPAGYVTQAGDQCVTDPNKTVPGDCGCGNTETDTDSDGNADCIDPDDDNDGVSDAADCQPLNSLVGEATLWYQDADGDGMGDIAIMQYACTKPAGYVQAMGDQCPADAAKTTPGDCGCGKQEGTCTDCAGMLNGSAKFDVCNVCAGGTTGITPKTDVSECGTTTGVESGMITGLTIYPNPGVNDFNVSVDQGVFNVSIYNAAGQLMLQGTYDTETQLGNELLPGIYLMRLEQNGIVETRKIIKQ